MTPPLALLAAFRAADEKAIEIIGVLLDGDGFDATTLRVMSAWQNSEHQWNAPKKPCPDNGRPTAAAWRWLCSGWTLDVVAIANGANVSTDTARERLTILQHARLIYPDGEVNKFAKQALGATIAQRISKAQGKDKKKAKTDGSGGVPPPAN